MNELKIVILGSGGVGKSALTVQFVQNFFVEKYDPTIEDSYRKEVNLDGKSYTLELLDTAGTEQFTSMRDLYMKNGDGYILVYSITAQSSLTDLIEIRDHIVRTKNSTDVPLVLVGNKSDLDFERVVTKAQGQDLAKNFNCVFMETSAKSRINVDEIFNSVAKQIIAKKTAKQQTINNTKQATTVRQNIKNKPEPKKPQTNLNVDKDCCIIF